MSAGRAVLDLKLLSNEVDDLLQECDTRFSVSAGRAVLDLKLLSNEVDDLFQECDTRFSVSAGRAVLDLKLLSNEVDDLFQECDTRFSVSAGRAVLDLKLLSNEVGELTYANITDLQELYWHDLPPPVSMSAEVRLWMKKWDSSEETKRSNLQETKSATSSYIRPQIFSACFTC